MRYGSDVVKGQVSSTASQITDPLGRGDPLFSRPLAPQFCMAQPVGDTASAPQKPTTQPVAQIPLPPSFSSFKFTKIGQQPKLLERFSDLSPGTNVDVEPEPQCSASPEPPIKMDANASGKASVLGLGRPTLLQALGGSDINSHANMDVDRVPCRSTSPLTTGPGAATKNGIAAVQVTDPIQSRPARTQYSSTGDRSARSLYQSRRTSNSNGAGSCDDIGAIYVDTDSNTNNNANSNLAPNKNEIEYTNRTPQRDASPDLLYPSPSIHTPAPESRSTHVTPPTPTSYLSDQGPLRVSCSVDGDRGTSTSSPCMSDLLALRKSLETKTAGLKARAARDRERDALTATRSHNSDSGSQLNVSSPTSGQDTQRSPSDTHEEPNNPAESSLDAHSNQDHVTVSPQDESLQRSAQSPMELDTPSDASLPVPPAGTEMSPRSHASTLSSNKSGCDIIVGDNTPSISFSQPESPSSQINAASQFPRDTLDSAMSSMKQWLNDMSRARSEIRTLLARAIAAESATTSLRSELTRSQSESNALREHLSSTSALLRRAQIETTQLEERVGTLEAEVAELRGRKEEEWNERQVSRQEVEEAVKVGQGIMEFFDRYFGQQEPQDDEGNRIDEEERERVVRANADMETQAHLEQEEEEGPQETQRQQEEMLEKDAVSFSNKRAEVMMEKERVNQENAEPIRAERYDQPISGGDKVSCSAMDTVQADDSNSLAVSGKIDLPVSAPASTHALRTGSSTSAESRGPSTPPSPLGFGVQVNYATQASNLRHLREARLAAAAPADGDPKPALVETEGDVEPKKELQVKPEEEEEDKFDVKMETENEDGAHLVSSDAPSSDPPACRSSPPSSAQTQVAAESPSLLHPSDKGQRAIPSESLPTRPSVPLPPAIPADAVHLATPMVSQTTLSSGFPSMPQSNLSNTLAADGDYEEFVGGNLAHRSSGGEFQPPRVLVPDSLARLDAPEPEPVNNTFYDHQRPCSPPPCNSAHRQREHGDQYFPPPARPPIPPPSMQYRRRSDHYSPPPPADMPSRQRYSPPPSSPRSPGLLDRMARPRKRPISTTDRYVPDEEPPARRPWQGDSNERPPTVEARYEYGRGHDAPNGPRTPPRSALWDHAPESEPLSQYDSRFRSPSPAPTFRDGRTIRFRRGESYRRAYDPQPEKYHEASPAKSGYRQWERQNPDRIPDMYGSAPGPSASAPLASRMDIDGPHVSIEPIQRRQSQQEPTNPTLLDRMSDNQRPPPSGPSFALSHGHNRTQFQTSDNVRWTPGQGPRGQYRSGRPARGRGGRGGSTEHPNLERQTLAARISGGSTLQDRLS